MNDETTNVDPAAEPVTPEAVTPSEETPAADEPAPQPEEPAADAPAPDEEDQEVPNADESRTGFAEVGLKAGDACTCPDGRAGTVHRFDAGLVCIPNQD